MPAHSPGHDIEGGDQPKKSPKNQHSKSSTSADLSKSLEKQATEQKHPKVSEQSSLIRTNLGLANSENLPKQQTVNGLASNNDEALSDAGLLNLPNGHLPRDRLLRSEPLSA